MDFATQIGTHVKNFLKILLKEIDHLENSYINGRTVGYRGRSYINKIQIRRLLRQRQILWLYKGSELLDHSDISNIFRNN